MQAPSNLQSHISRVTSRLINCDIRIISRTDLKNLDNTKEPPTGLNKHEKEAFSYYTSIGYEVIRLEHQFLSLVGEKEHLFAESKALGDKLRSLIPRRDYLKLIHRNENLLNKKALVLNSVYPRDYSLAFYPPDFIAVKKRLLGANEFKFIEVKGPTDRLHFRQANWYVNLMPNHWQYEIFASINEDIEEIYIERDTPTKGVEFDETYEMHKLEVKEFRAASKTKRKTHKENLEKYSSESMKEHLDRLEKEITRVNKALDSVAINRPRKKRSTKV